ncbi:MAG: ATP-binding protein [Myxococcota bacterium]
MLNRRWPRMAKVSVGKHTLALPNLGLKAEPEVRRVLDALANVEIHVQFDARPLWQQAELDIREGPRWPTTIESAPALARFAKNLPNALHALKDEGGEVWARVIERARLGLGPEVTDFKFPLAGRGRIELSVVMTNGWTLPADSLSEGQLTYLSCIALMELHPTRSVLAFDEPETHLHPTLLARVVGMFEEASATCPVILATHSDRLLDALADPAGSVVLCDLDERHAARLRRPDRAALDEWLESYRGLGSLRAEGYASHVFHSALGPAEEAP